MNTMAMGETNRPYFWMLCVALLSIMVGCSGPDMKNMQTLLDRVSNGPEGELGVLIYGYSEASPGAQQILLNMIRPLRAPSSDKHMTIAASQSAGRFTMLSVRVPWRQPTQGYGFKASFQPILICHESGHDYIAGYVLPFDDILPRFQGFDKDDYTVLSQWWIENYGMR